MTLNAENIITYNDILQDALLQIKNGCVNINNVLPEVPGELRNGHASTIATALVPHVVANSSGNPVTVTHTLSATVNITDNILDAVPEETVINQLNAFLISRGIMSKVSSVISFKGMIQFYNHLSAFLSQRLVFVASSLTPEIFVFYNQYASNYPTTPVIGDTINYTPAELKVSLENIIQTLSSSTLAYHPYTRISYHSSCSCSSSSCSCSSSSCSSSSSVYIVYMDI